jgi:hypothetical protein
MREQHSGIVSEGISEIRLLLCTLPQRIVIVNAIESFAKKMRKAFNFPVYAIS